MNPKNLRNSLSVLALAGLAVGLAAPAHAGSSDKPKTESKGCKGKASCKGMKTDTAAKAEDRSCAGNGYCGGTSEAKGTAVDSAKGRILSAKTEKEFEKACKDAGKMVEKATCAGQNSCAGIYLIKGKTFDVSCKGQAKCMGLKCAA
jgi:hypothetical protein